MSRRRIPKAPFVWGTCANCGHAEIEHLPPNHLGRYERCHRGACSCPKDCACHGAGCTCRQKTGSCIVGCEHRSECTCPRWRGIGFNPDTDRWQDVLDDEGRPVTFNETLRVYDEDGRVVTKTVRRTRRQLVTPEG